MATKQKASRVKIVPHLWFDDDAVEAADFYATLFPDSHVDSVTALPADTPSGPAGSVQVVEMTIFGHPFMAISAGPEFRINPSISFLVNFDPKFFDGDARKKLDVVWQELSEGGKTLIPIDEYPFSKRYGWVQDRYGVSWQLILSDPDGDPRPPIVPSLLFTRENCGKAEEAMRFYQSVFEGSKQGIIARYGAGQAPDREGTVMYGDFMLEGQWFAAMDSAKDHDFVFSEAVSLMVNCKDQDEIDTYWKKLSAHPEAEQCGWLKDRYGVSWQIVPEDLEDMLKDSDRSRAKRVTEAFLGMKKLDIARLEEAYGAHP